MKTYDLERLIKMWETEKLTAEQAVGQMLLYLQQFYGRIGLLERELHELKQKMQYKRG